MKFADSCKRTIEYSFYILFFLVPLIFWGNTSELFELNKMWLTYGISLIIIGTWLINSIIRKQLYVQKTPLDIPLILFLISQILSTIFSLDSHVSFWGYYSRFNGGLLSTIIYILLYYAFVTHFTASQTLRLIKVALVSGLLVVTWGIPSHFGYDPTCYLFRGELNVSCWTEAFKPTIRIFSTLGQPAWMAAYLAVLLPISIAMLIQILSPKSVNSIWQMVKSKKLLAICYLLFTTLFYISLLYTGTRAGFIGFWLANIVFWIMVFLKKLFLFKRFVLLFVILNSLFLILNFFIGTPISILNNLSFNRLIVSSEKQTVENKKLAPDKTEVPNITDSADIRQIVWRGAIDAWHEYPILGSGVETFAFAYYKHKPLAHNTTSEWDYLYNKAHNEYLNYLTTTGIVGLGSYLLFIVLFVIHFIKTINSKLEALNSKQYQNSKIINSKLLEHSGFENSNLFKVSILDIRVLSIGLFTGWLSILITNFFGFSVVIINLFFFLIPAFIFILNDKLTSNQALIYPRFNKLDNQTNNPDGSFHSGSRYNRDKLDNHISVSQWIAITFILLTTLYFLLNLFRYWQADKAYSLGSNLLKSNYSQDAYASLTEAVALRPNEPVFQDELSVSALQLSLGLFQQNQATLAAQLAQQAMNINGQILTDHPKYLPFWKTRLRLFYALSEIEPSYAEVALNAANQASIMAPTDAKIWYNLGVLYGQTGDGKKGIEILEKTISMKPDYQDAYLALGLLYRQLSINEKNKVTDLSMQKKAEQTIRKLLELNPNHEQANQTIVDWSTKDEKPE